MKGDDTAVMQNLFENIQKRTPDKFRDDMQLKVMASMDDINEYQKSDANLEFGKTLCLALDLREFNNQADKYDIGISYAPQFLTGLAGSNLTVYQTGTYDIGSGNNYKYIGYP